MVDGELVPSLRGVHGCRIAHLPYWVAEELWTMELDGDVVDAERMVVGRRARLVDPVSEWDAAAMREFTLACADRARDVPGYGEDAQIWAAHSAGVGPVSYIAAHAAALGAPDWTEGFVAERRWQAQWLRERLGLGE